MEPLCELRLRIFRTPDAPDLNVELGSTDGRSVWAMLPELNLRELLEIADPQTYGRRLFDWVFQGKIEALLRETEVLVGSLSSLNIGTKESPISLRLEVDPQLRFASTFSERKRLDWTSIHEQIRKGEAPKTATDTVTMSPFQVCWESMYDTRNNTPFFLTYAFSRYLLVKAPRSRPLWERPLRMLTCISNPANLAAYSLPAIDPFFEEVFAKVTERTQRSWGSFVEVTTMADSPTLAQLGATLAQSEYHIIHIVAHIVGEEDGAALLLTGDDQNAQPVSFQQIAELFQTTSRRRPHLVFLSLPANTANEYTHTLVRLAQMLLEAGALATVATQGAISMTNLRSFVEMFYRKLFETGRIDEAMRVARSEIFDEDNWEWVYPVLYTRTPDSQLFQPLPESLESSVYGKSIKY